MKRTPRSWLAALALIALSTMVLSAQVATAPTIKFKQPKPKIDSFKGHVVNFTPAAVTVRDLKDTTKVRTFGYTPELTRKLENRYIENGSKITVKYQHLSDTAVALKAKTLRQDLPIVAR